MDQKIRLIELANVLWGRAKVADIIGDRAEGWRLREQYRERLRIILAMSE